MNRRTFIARAMSFCAAAVMPWRFPSASNPYGELAQKWRERIKESQPLGTITVDNWPDGNGAGDYEWFPEKPAAFDEMRDNIVNAVGGDPALVRYLEAKLDGKI